ncbi:GMC oxidoreductase [Microbacterium sp. NPDC056044]|uniref:GMC oxidoreductase n=1 Tax=Microbacterium sp. NPDC056044 TaxID=3345690 RepID=UPI0035DEB49F
MIIDARRRMPVELPTADVCVVGAGPAGISLALRLEELGHSVLLIESGGVRETEPARDLNRGSADPVGSHEPLEENRRRQWGGASAVWGGRCIPFDALDFERREWVPESGWPFPRSELDSHYEIAMELCEAGEMSFDARQALPDTPGLLRGLDGDGVTTYQLERWSPPTHFGKRYGRRLAASSRVVAVRNATCTHVQLASDGRSVAHIIVTSPTGVSRRIDAGTFVLAAGGLENARILMHSCDVALDGIGNHSGKLGRYYQTHLFGCLATMELSADAPPAHVAFDRDAHGVYCRRRIWIAPDAQQQHSLLNTVFFPVRPPTGATGHRSALFSGVFLFKTLIAAVRRPTRALSHLREERQAIANHLGVFFRHLPSAVPEIYRAIVGRYVGKRRLPAVLPPDGSTSYHLQFQAEQVPHPDARLTLSDERDAMGMRRIVVTPGATQLDVDSVVGCHHLLDERLRTTGLGHLQFDENELRDAVEASTRQVNSGAHHIGTTRMSRDPSDGVVDRDCRVHGVDNLYVVGSSVMPTSGHANPTLTIVALALRLADHLATDQKPSRS